VNIVIKFGEHYIKARFLITTNKFRLASVAFVRNMNLRGDGGQNVDVSRNILVV